MGSNSVKLRSERILKLQKTMRDKKISALLVSDISNVGYLSGFEGSEAELVVLPRYVYLITDFRYQEVAENTTDGIRIAITKTEPKSILIARICRKHKVKVLSFNPAYITYAQAESLKSNLRPIKIKKTADLCASMRIIKTPEEIKIIRESGKIAVEAWKYILPMLKNGVRENEIAAELAYRLRYLGAQGEAFPSIVAFGERASLPHATPTTRKLKEKDMVLIDWGARLRFYNSDLTRVVFNGMIQKQFATIYDIVLKAQKEAIKTVRASVRVADVDKAARSIIEDAGYGKNFGHSTGHGLGLKVHEGPGVSSKSELILKPGMVITVEPGIYIQGWGGIRIEDDVLVTENGSEVLTSAPKELDEIRNLI